MSIEREIGDRVPLYMSQSWMCSAEVVEQTEIRAVARAKQASKPSTQPHTAPITSLSMSQSHVSTVDCTDVCHDMTCHGIITIPAEAWIPPSASRNARRAE